MIHAVTPTITAHLAPATCHQSVELLDLEPIARAGAERLLRLHPQLRFTSGRRTVEAQARAMASNVALGNRTWVVDTYRDSEPARALQAFVDAHPAIRGKRALTEGFLSVLSRFTPEELAHLSRHLGGLAFDIQPTRINAEAIKRDIRELPGLHLFLDREGGLVRWHVQFHPEGA
jgi:hypothetical protein